MLSSNFTDYFLDILENKLNQILILIIEKIHTKMNMSKKAVINFIIFPEYTHLGVHSKNVQLGRAHIV